MDIIVSALAEVIFLVIYAAILGMVTPYVLGKNEDYGSIVPASAALLSGLVLWLILIWAGMPTSNAFTWIIVMLLMPVAMYFGLKYLAKRRDTENVEILADFVRGVSKTSDYLGS
jgi:hypothetical protein